MIFESGFRSVLAAMTVLTAGSHDHSCPFDIFLGIF